MTATDIQHMIALYTGLDTEPDSAIDSLSTKALLAAWAEYRDNAMSDPELAALPPGFLKKRFIVHLSTNLIDLTSVSDLRRNLQIARQQAGAKLDEAQALLDSKADMQIGNDRNLSYPLVQAQVQFIHRVCTVASTQADIMRAKIAATQSAAKTIRMIKGAIESLNTFWDGVANTREIDAYTNDLKMGYTAYDEAGKQLSVLADRADKLYATAMRRDSAIRMLINSTNNGSGGGDSNMRQFSTGIDPMDHMSSPDFKYTQEQLAADAESSL